MLRTKGFTLVELSIVLVVIGLLVGGVMLGRDLIAGAKMRAMLSQINEFSTGYGAFKAKYEEAPGDISKNITEFGFMARSGAPGMGDGNGLVQSPMADGSINTRGFCGEAIMIWHDLMQAGLIRYKSRITSNDTSQMNALVNNQDYVYPKIITASGGAAYVIPYNLQFTELASPGPLMWMISGRYVSTDPNCNSQVYPSLTPTEAYEIDLKIDDGRPGRGNVRASRIDTWGSGVDPNGFFPAQDYVPGQLCASTAETYNFSGATANVVHCNLAILAGF